MLTHTFASGLPANYGVELTIRDDDGGETGMSIPLNQLPPSLDFVPDQVVDEGEELQLDFTFSDPENPPDDMWTYEINWGDGTVEGPFTATVDVPGGPTTDTEGSFFGAHRYGNESPTGSYVVVVTVTDAFGGNDIQDFRRRGAGCGPRAHAGQSNTSGRNEGEEVALAGTYSPSNPGLRFSDPAFSDEVVVRGY